MTAKKDKVTEIALTNRMQERLQFLYSKRAEIENVIKSEMLVFIDAKGGDTNAVWVPDDELKTIKMKGEA